MYNAASLMVQWLRLCTSSAGGLGLIPGQASLVAQMIKVCLQ